MQWDSSEQSVWEEGVDYMTSRDACQPQPLCNAVKYYLLKSCLATARFAWFGVVFKVLEQHRVPVKLISKHSFV